MIGRVSMMEPRPARRSSALIVTAIVTTIAGTAAPAAAQWPLGPQAMPQGLPTLGQPLPLPGAEETVRRLDAARERDAGRRLEWVWIDVQGGFEQVGLTTFKHDGNLTGGVTPTSASTGVIGLGVGARLLFFTALLRGRVAIGSIGQLFRVGPEVGLHVPLGRVEPHVALGGGFAAFTGPLAGLLGGYARVGAGVDFFLAPIFSLGVDASAELLGTRRPAASAIGGTVSVTSVLGLHF